MYLGSFAVQPLYGAARLSSRAGFEVHFRVNGERVYADAGKLLAQMAADGFAPPRRNAPHRRSGGQGCQSQAPDGPECPRHRVAFRVFTKDGRSWGAHRLPDGTWCHATGKAEKGA